jgi:L-aminopeptidase/D-esterase-like protein
MLDDESIDPVYEGVVQGTEEAVLNAMLAATTMSGASWLRVPALPHDKLRAVLAKAGRLAR